MKRISKALAFLITLYILLSTSVAAYAAPDPTGMAAAAKESAAIGADAAELVAAVQQKDTDKLVDLLMNWLGDYYRQNGLKDDFGYFNADAYLTAYQDVNTECKGDRRQALEHYIVIGAKEGKISGGKYDLPLAVRIDPSFLLSPAILNAMGDPAAFLKAAEKPVELITKASRRTDSSSGGGNTPDGPASHTLIFYGSASDLNLEESLLRGILPLYGTENINIIMALGGSYNWSNEYLMNLLGRTEGSTDNKNKTGFFAVNVSELNSALDRVSEEFGISVSSMIEKIEDNTEEGNKLKSAVNSAVYSEHVLPLVEGTAVSSDAGLGSSETLRTVLELAKTEYPAETYALSFSGHGGGPNGCLQSDDESPMLDSRMIDEALDSAGFGEQNRMSLIAFDACSMGCVETAAVLGRYCEYMYGSEAEQINDINMNVWLSAVKDNLYSKDFSKAVAYAIYEQRASLTFFSLSTAAISDSKYAQELLDAIEQWSEAMLAGMKDASPNTAEEYFQALRKASVYCYQVSPNASVFDIMDLMQEIKSFLNHNGNDSMDSLTDAVITAADALSEQNSVSIDERYLYDSMKGGVIDSHAEYRDKHLKYDLCGYSIKFPDYLLTRLIQVPNGTPEEEQKHIDDIRNQFTEGYLSKYEKLGLQRYTELISEYLNYYFTVAEADRIRELSKELTSCSNKNGTVAGYKDIVSVLWNEDKTYAQVKIEEYPEGTDQSEWSSGDVLIDLIDTSDGFRAYLTSKLEVTKEDRTKNIDMVFVNNNISYQCVKGYQSCIELQLNDFLNDANRRLSYVEKDGVSWADADYLDLVLDAQQTGNSINKEVVLIAVVSGFSDKIAEREAARQAYEADPTNEEKRLAFEAADAECANICEEYTLYYGECKASDDVTNSKTYDTIRNAFLVFHKDSDNTLVYFDAAKKSGSGDTYEHIDNAQKIRFYHYEVSDVFREEEKDTGTDQLTAIETGTDYEGSYYDNEKYVYDITDQDKPVVVKTIKLQDFLYLKEGASTADSFGYYFSLKNADGQTVILNSENDGQNAALIDENYTTPLTWGQLKAISCTASTEPSEEPAETEPLEESKEDPASKSKDYILAAALETQEEQSIPNAQPEQVNEPEQPRDSEDTAAKEQEQPEQSETTEEEQPSAESENEAA